MLAYKLPHQIRVPDPELLAHIEMTRAEMSALKKQLSVLRSDKTELHSERSDLQRRLGEQQALVTKLQAALQASQQGTCELSSHCLWVVASITLHVWAQYPCIATF